MILTDLQRATLREAAATLERLSASLDVIIEEVRKAEAIDYSNNNHDGDFSTVEEMVRTLSEEAGLLRSSTHK